MVFWLYFNFSPYSKFHEAKKQCFIQHGFAECLRMIVTPSDTSYRELSQTSQIKGTVLHKTYLTADTSHEFGSPQATLISDLLATIQNFPLSLRCDHSLEQLKNLGRHSAYDYSFITAKGYKSEPAKNVPHV